MTFDEFRTKIRDWVAVNTSVNEVIFENEDGTRPEKPYITIGFINSNQIGQADYETDAAGVQSIRYNEDISISIIAFGYYAYDILKGLRLSLNKTTVLDELNSSGIVIRDEGSIQNITIVLSDRFDYRFVYDIIVGIGNESTDDTGYIETAEITGSVDGIDISDNYP